MRRPIVSKSERSGTGVDKANLSKAVCHGESDKCRFGNPPQESNFQRLGISHHAPIFLISFGTHLRGDQMTWFSVQNECRRQSLGARVRACKPNHLMASFDEF